MINAICFSGPYSKEGFLTEQEALDYIYENSCIVCREDVNQGYMEDGWGEIIEINDILDTMCGAEWSLEFIEN